jgi:type VI secretion system protein ImpH
MSRSSFLPMVRKLEREVGLDRIHFTHPPHFTFPHGEVLGVARDEAGDVHITTALLGLLGAESPLAAAMSEEVVFDDESGHVQAFLDVFQSRALQLLYLAWKRFAPDVPDAHDGFHCALLSLMGIDAFSPYEETRGVDDSFLLGLSDFARCEPGFLDLAGLEQILQRTYPELSPQVEAGEPQLILAADEDRMCLGGQNSTMGVDANFGGGATDTQGSIRLVVGPVDRTTSEELMPGGSRYVELQRFVDHWMACRVTPELEVVLKQGAAPVLSLDDDYGCAMGHEARFSGEAAPLVRVRVPLTADVKDVVARRYRDG